MKPALVLLFAALCLTAACGSLDGAPASGPATSAGPDVASGNQEDAGAVQAARVVITSTLFLEPDEATTLGKMIDYVLEKVRIREESEQALRAVRPRLDELFRDASST